MATRVTITNPPAVQESARATVAANRKRLEEREVRYEFIKKAELEIKRNKQKQRQKDDGAVPEFEKKGVLPKRRWSKGVFSWIIQEQKFTRKQSRSYVPILDGSLAFRRSTEEINFAKIATGEKAKKAYLNKFTFKVDYVEQNTEWELQDVYDENIRGPATPEQQLQAILNAINELGEFYQAKTKTYPVADGITYTRNLLPEYATNSFANCTILEQEKNRVLFRFATSLTSQNAGGVGGLLFSREEYRIALGLFVPIPPANKKGYVYIFRKITPGALEIPFFTGNTAMTKLSQLNSGTEYPETVITGNSNHIYIAREEVSVLQKQNLKQWYRQGILDYSMRSLGLAGDLEYGYMGHVEWYFTVGAPIPANTGSNTVAFDETVEVVYTDKDLGPLL